MHSDEKPFLTILTDEAYDKHIKQPNLNIVYLCIYSFIYIGSLNSNCMGNPNKKCIYLRRPYACPCTYGLINSKVFLITIRSLASWWVMKKKNFFIKLN